LACTKDSRRALLENVGAVTVRNRWLLTTRLPDMNPGYFAIERLVAAGKEERIIDTCGTPSCDPDNVVTIHSFRSDPGGLTNPLLPHVLKIQPRRRKCRSSRPHTALKKLSYLLPYFSLALSAGDPVLPSPLAAPAEVLIKKYKSQGQKGKRGGKNARVR
jgi:hypothetical protein